jgi:hypothetical protein
MALERRHQPLAGQREFAWRLARYAGAAVAMLVVSLALGIAGYMVFEHLSLIDAFLNAAMLLGGMGPVNAPQSFAGKLFAGMYALYAGLVFVATTAILFTPLLHRLLHRFHLEGRD